MRKSGKPRGIALIATLLVMLIIMVMAMGFVFFTVNDMTVTKNVLDSNLTLNLSEAGIDYALYLLKHNMTMFPGTDSSGSYSSGYAVFNATYYSTAGYGNVTANYANGSLINLNLPLGSTQEHVVVSDLSYPGNNFMSEGSFCGTFEVFQTITSSGTTRDILFRSVGRVRQIPVDPSSIDWTTILTSTIRSWPEKAKRTLNVKVTLQTNLTATHGNDLIEKNFYEQFR